MALAPPARSNHQAMTHTRVFVLTSLVMLAFAGNSLLCRLALNHTGIDAASFTTLRLVSGALMLLVIVRVRRNAVAIEGSWTSAFALFIYAAGFSFAYVDLPVATGALLLYAAVQATMIGHGIWQGEPIGKVQSLGILLAFGGFVGLLLPGISSPPLLGSILMLGAGIAWGIYSVRGKAAGDPSAMSAGNFIRAVPITALLSLFMLGSAEIDLAGVWLAVISGAGASAIGYVLWYAVLPALRSTQGAIVQLSVPVITAAGGVAFLGETVTSRLILATIAILGGIALFILEKRPTAKIRF